MEHRRVGFVALSQCALVLGLLASLALRPPAVGSMLVVPMHGTSQGDLLNIVVRQGGIILGGGAISGSLIVFGERAKLLPALLNARAVAVAAPAFACGDLPAGFAGQKRI